MEKKIPADVMSRIQGVYNALSPENLACDGEASRAHIRREGARLRSSCSPVAR